MIWKQKRRLRSVVGLTLNDGQLSAAHLLQSKKGLEVVKVVSVPLALDLLEQEPAAVGKEIRDALATAEIKERNCVVAVPTDWIMSQSIKLPELSAEDAASFIELEAEKGFPYDVGQMQLATAPRTAGAGYVTQFAVRKDRLAKLGSVLAAAGLKPVSLTLGLAALDGVVGPLGNGRVTIAVESTGVTVLVAAGGGIAALRSLRAEAIAEGEVFKSDAVNRELRVTLEQLPSELRRDLKEISICGRSSLVGPLADSLAGWTGRMGLRLVKGGVPDGKLGDQIAEGLARRWLDSANSGIEFLAAQPSPWVQFQARYSSKRLATAGLAVGGVLVLALPIIGWQEIHLRLLRSQWNGMQAQVAELSDIQDKIRAYRPWDDKTFQNLQILGRVTQCFPSTGSVTAKSVDIHLADGATVVSVTGTTTNQPTLLKTLETLRKAQEIQDLKVESISGKTAAEFTFTFHWIGGFAP